jgi:hypothetical protein
MRRTEGCQEGRKEVCQEEGWLEDGRTEGCQRGTSLGRRKGGKKEGGWMGEESKKDLEWSNKKRKGKEDEGVRKRGREKRKE